MFNFAGSKKKLHYYIPLHKLKVSKTLKKKKVISVDLKIFPVFTALPSAFRLGSEGFVQGITDHFIPVFTF